jgi:hypothetical protein
VLLLFLDGVGLAPAGPDNPLAVVEMPALRQLLGGPLTSESVQVRHELCLRGIDATLGVPGLPQSATGQSALYTGINAARRLGHHVAAFPGPRLRALLERGSLFRALARRGASATLANAYSPRYEELVRARRLRWPASVWALWAGGGRLRGLGELVRGEAVTWDVIRDHWNAGSTAAPSVSPERAGRDLAALAAAHRLTVFESHLTDLAGHGRFALTAAEALRRIDGLLAGVISSRSADATVVVVSDHGNVEDSSHHRHTRNPVPLLAFGPHAANFRRVRSLTGVAPAVLRILGAGRGHVGWGAPL